MNAPGSFTDIAAIGVMISQAWPDSRQTEGATQAALATVLEACPECRLVQTVDIPSAGERKAVAALTRGQGRAHTYTLTRILAERGLNLSALDDALRRASVAEVIRRLPDALEAGASVLGLVSGSAPASGRRDEALKALAVSLAEIGAAARAYPQLEVLIEPLDHSAHKRATLGTTAEAVDLCQQLDAQRFPVKLCIDTAHLLLNGEDILAAVDLAGDRLLEFHFCNPVLNRQHALFGDRHLPFGPPGDVDIPQIAAWMAGLYRRGFLSTSRRPRVFCEVWKPANLKPMAVVRHGLDVLEAAWEEARVLLTQPLSASHAQA